MKKLIISAAALSFSLFAGSALAQIRPQLPAPGEAPAGSPVAVHGALKVGKVGSNGAILDKNNTAVVLRGMSFDWSDNAGYGAYYKADVVGWLAHDWRVSVVRAAMTVHSGDNDGDKCDGDPGYVDTEAGKTANGTRVKNVVEAAIERGIYVIIDWHMHKLTPSCGPQSGKNLTANATAFFREMATSYGKYPNVIYEVWNEPLSEGWSTISSYANTVTSAIRTAGGTGVVVVGSPSWSSQPGAGTVSDNNSAYTIHFYANEHQSTSGHASNMENAVKAGKAVFATEWGTTNADGDKGHNESQSGSWITNMETYKVGWANWRISHDNQGSAALLSGGASGPPWSLSASGRYIQGKISSANNTAYSSWSKTYPITVTTEGSGTVEKKVGSAVKNGPYDYGESVALTAVPAAGYQFDHWEGDATGGNAALAAYKINGRGLNIKAVFVQGSMIKNGSFTYNYNDWQASGITLVVEDGTLKATVTGTTAFIRQTGLNMTKNTKYTLTFRAKAGSGSVALTPRITNSSGAAHWEGDAVSLTTSWAPKTVEICMPADDANAQIRFQTNNASDAVWYIDDIKLDATGAANCGSGIPDSCALPNPKPGCDNYCQAYPSAAQCQPDTCALPNPRPGCANYCQANPTAEQCLPPDSCETNPEKCVGVVLPNGMKAQRAVWSVSRAGGSLQLRGPAEAGARVSLYDIRGKLVRSMAAVDGLTLGANIPAGSYVLIVKGRAGGEVLRTKVVLTR